MNKREILKARRETRGCENIVHFNNAGASLISSPVADYLYDFLTEEEMIGGYETAATRAEELEGFYAVAAKLLNAHPDEIAFIENATRAWDMVFYALPFGPNDRILTTKSEYGSNIIAYLHRAKQTGAELIVIDNDEHGQIDIQQLQESIDERVKLIAISHIPTGGGLVNPAREVGKVAKKNGIPFLLDACQSVGQMALNVQDLACDFLSATGRKYLRAPRGTGFLYVKRNWIDKLEPPLIDQYAAELIDRHNYVLRQDARRFENWERYFAGQATLGKAIEYAMAFGLKKIQKRIFELADQLRQELHAIPEIEVTDQGIEKCGIVTFRSDCASAKHIKATLGAEGINVSVSSGSGMRLSFVDRGLDEVVRASLHYYNTKDELERFLSVIKRI